MSAANLSQPGTLVHARGREWIVLPDSTDDLLMLRPVGGLDEEVTGLLPSVEPITSATFSFPTRNDLGDFQAGALLRDAARISTRAVHSDAIMPHKAVVVLSIWHSNGSVILSPVVSSSRDGSEPAFGCGHTRLLKLVVWVSLGWRVGQPGESCERAT